MSPEEKIVAATVRQLREHFGESQQQFSERMSVVVRTVARWELEKPPKGKMLVELHWQAIQGKRDDLARIFATAAQAVPSGMYAIAFLEKLRPSLENLVSGAQAIDRGAETLTAENQTAMKKLEAQKEIRKHLSQLVKELEFVKNEYQDYKSSMKSSAKQSDRRGAFDSPDLERSREPRKASKTTRREAEHQRSHEDL